MVRQTLTLALTCVLGAAAFSTAKAQYVSGHPGVNEVDRRLSDQQGRVDAGVNQGQIGARGTAVDGSVDARVGRQLSRDQALHNGHVTGREYAHLNHELNRNSRRIYAQRHR